MFIAMGCDKTLDMGCIMGKRNTVLGDATNVPSAANRLERSAMPSIPAPQFYVYVLARPNGKPFYVGKGSGPRMFMHDYEARSGHDCRKCRIMRKIWREGGDVIRYTIFTTDDESEALAYEVETIALFGRKTLANGTNGGEGISGHVHDEATREKIAAASRRFHADPEFKAKQRAGVIAAFADPERRAKMRERQIERAKDPAYRAELSAQGHARYSDPAERAAQSERMKKALADPAVRARKSAAGKAAWAYRKLKRA